MGKRSLSDAELELIAWADPAESTQELACRLGRTGNGYFVVARARQRIRREGWGCRLATVDCGECGQPLLTAASGHHRRTFHPACCRARQRRTQATYRAQHPEQVAARRARYEAKRRQRWVALPPSQRAARLAVLQAANARDAVAGRLVTVCVVHA